ncbi:hypothetical protein ASF46_15380 [Rathayibacter sp. Leaf296]|nr:hypothetical protein ASF46_15380 [Rathayibacter sp. Leaf296]
MEVSKHTDLHVDDENSSESTHPNSLMPLRHRAQPGSTASSAERPGLLVDWRGGVGVRCNTDCCFATDHASATREKRGTWAYFSLVPGALDSLAGMLTRV